MMLARQPSTPPDAALPAQIGERYRVEGLLGRGGMAAVYRVHDRQLGRTVALKQALASESERHHARLAEMLAREYRTLAQLSHPSVITVYEYGLDPLGPYYTMELLDGSDLHQVAPVPFRQACIYMRDVASCLALLHSRRLVHRDTSPRNIRCQDGRAKLIDFGALAPMGPSKQIVGTPPLVPPEVLHRQALDGRCDLYALGAAFYWALTRRHAYPARNLQELPQIWLQRPLPPSAFAPDVPEALDALVLSLLSPEPDARPRSAAEVMQQLSRIAGLPDDESLHVSQAYLNTPSLQGREAELSHVRAALGGASRRSRLMWVEGEAGVGRSRFLGAALLEARLAGATVVDVSAADVVPGELSLVRELLARALEVLPQRDDVTGTRELLAAFENTRELPEHARARLVSRVRAMLRRACAKGPVAIAVDDIDAADGASQAVLAGLRRGVRRNLLIIASATPGGALDPALLTQRAEIEPVVLGALSPEQTEALLGSVFGDVPSLHAVATRLHKLSHGNPRATLELAEHLVSTGKARYALGGWQLPEALPSAELPAAWTTALDSRVLALPDDARELATLLSLAFEHGLVTTDLDALTEHGDVARRQIALDALIRAGLVRLEDERPIIARGADRERVIALSDEALLRSIYDRLARFLRARGADPIAIARYELRAGQDEEAIDTLLQELSRGSRCDTAPADYAQVLEQALAATCALQRPRAHRFRLLQELSKVGDHLGIANMPEVFVELFAQLRQDSGLDAYEALPSELEPLARLQQAFEVAQARYDALAEHERVLAPIEAISALSHTVRHAAAFGAVALDYDLIESLPSLTPFTPLSEALKSTVENTLPASAHLTAARYERAREGYGVTLQRVLQPDRAGLDEETWHWASYALRFALGHLNAGLGNLDCMRFAEELERDAAWVIAAWDVRRAYYLRQGNWREAEACRDRIERLRVQSARRPPMVDTSARLELDTSAHAGDLLGMRRAMQRLEGMIELHPGYAVYGHYGPAVIEHLQGNEELALQHVDRALAMVKPGRHPTWPWIASCRLEILLALGRYEQTKTDGLAFLEQSRAVGLQVMQDHITLPLALAEAHLGEHAVAVERIQQAIEYRTRLGSTGLNMGWAYEIRARVAIIMRDQPAYTQAALACAREYGHGRGGSSFARKYEALRVEARQAGLLSASELPPASTEEATASTLSTLAGNTAIEDRWSLALDLLVSAAGAKSGVLYRVGAGAGTYQTVAIERCACSYGGVLPEQAAAWVSSLLVTQLDEATTATDSDSESLSSGPGSWSPIALGYLREGRFERTGAALLWFEHGASPKGVGKDLIEAVARLLAN